MAFKPGDPGACSMSKFKVGDRVRALTTGGYGPGIVEVGDIGIVTYVYVDGRVCSVKFPKRNTSGDMYFHEIEPVETDSESELPSQAQETELHRLVRVANEGFEALRLLLNNHRNEIEDEFGGEVPHYLFLKIRTKPKRPEPITLSTGWKVDLAGDRVKVGCQEFYLDSLTSVLGEMCREDTTNIINRDGQFMAHRKGIGCRKNGNFIGDITWDDADKLLAYLEEHSV